MDDALMAEVEREFAAGLDAYMAEWEADLREHFGGQPVEEADEPDDGEARRQAVAELLAALLGDDALGHLDDIEAAAHPDEDEDDEDDLSEVREGREVGEKWQGPSGRWFTKRQDGRVVPAKGEGGDKPKEKTKDAKKPSPAERKQAAHDGIKAVLAGERSPEAVASLTGHLNALSVADLAALKKEHGLKASGLKAELVAKIAGRLKFGGAPKVEAPQTPPAAEKPAASAKAEPFRASGAVHGAGGLHKVTTPDGKEYLHKAASESEVGREVATSELAALAGVNVPAARRETVAGRDGVLQDFVKGTTADKDRETLVAAAKADPEQATKHAAFNFLVGAEDRHGGNYLVGEGGRVYSLDHADSLPARRSPADAADLMGQDEILYAMERAQGGGDVRFHSGGLRAVADKASGMAAALRSKGMHEAASSLETRGKVLQDLAGRQGPTESLLRSLATNAPEKSKASPVADPARAFVAARSAYGDLFEKRKKVGGVVTVPDLVDRMREAVPGLDVAGAHDLLNQWWEEDKLHLQVANDLYLEPRAGEAISTPKGTRFYVYFRPDEASS